jgi:hypothetical protein
MGTVFFKANQLIMFLLGFKTVLESVVNSNILSIFQLDYFYVALESD